MPPERTAWTALTVALLLSVLANGSRTLAAGVEGNDPYPVLIDAVSLVGYLTLYVTVVGLIRARVPRFHPSMWLDGADRRPRAPRPSGSPSSSGRTSTRVSTGGRSISCTWPCQ